MLQPVQTFLSSAYNLAEEGYEIFLKKPLFLLGDHGKKVGGLFLGLPRRQAIAVYGGLLWVIPIAMVSQFESLYMVRLGLLIPRRICKVGVFSFFFFFEFKMSEFVGKVNSKRAVRHLAQIF